jgi:uncharacterized membrane protein
LLHECRQTMSLIPSWAPNLHPLIVHFPIVLVMTAAAIDILDAVFGRVPWLRVAATALYLAGALSTVAAYLTGVQAGSTVFVPGMAHPVLTAHGQWAVASMCYCIVFGGLRLAALRTHIGRTRAARVLLLVFGLVGVVLIQQTAERGARLVYEFGTGVIGVP